MNENQVTIPQINALQHLQNTKQKAAKISAAGAEVYQIMDERDNDAIVAEITGGYLEREFIYNIEYQSKQGVQRALGLSIHAVDEVCRIMGGIQTEVLEPKLVQEEIIHPITKEKEISSYYEAKSISTDIITGNRVEVFYREPIFKKLSSRDGRAGVYKNEYAYQIAQSKARRNSRFAHIPKEAVRRWLEDYMKAFTKDKKKKGVIRVTFDRKYLPEDARNRQAAIDSYPGKTFVSPKKAIVTVPSQSYEEEATMTIPAEEQVSPPEATKPQPKKKATKKQTAEPKQEQAKEEQPAQPVSDENKERVKNALGKIKDLLVYYGITESKDRGDYMRDRHNITMDKVLQNPSIIENLVPVIEAEINLNRDATRKKFFAVATKLYENSEEAKNAFKERYDIKSFNDATKPQIDEFVTEMEELIKVSESEQASSKGEEETPFDEVNDTSFEDYEAGDF